MNKKALLDLVLLLIVFWTSWYFRSYIQLEFQGAFVIIITSLVSLLIIRLRGIDYKSIGFTKLEFNESFFKKVAFVSLLILAILCIGIIIFGLLFGFPDESLAVTTQPKSVLGFILDNIFMVWIITALGEEFIFRGIIINRLNELLETINSNKKIYAISLFQAIWFGLVHQSQGLSGIIITGLIGFGLGLYILKNKKSGLWPLIVGHGLIDTFILTLNFIF